MKQILFFVLFIPLIGMAQSVHSAKADAKADVTKENTITFVDQYEKIKSFDEVLSKFKGRTVYIDLWATWCGPCVAEFAYKDKLHAFADKQDIDLLYLSMDKDKDDAKWKKFIQKRKLSGYHMRASQALYKDVQKRFSQVIQGQKVFGIPYYIIIKDGEIVLPDAPRPSSGELLFTELLNYKHNER